jgi:hypothetical protein
MTWHAPKVWLPEDEVNETVLNEQVFDNSNWLYEKLVQLVPSLVSTSAANETDTTDYSPAGMTYKTLITLAPFVITEDTTLAIIYNGAFSHSALKTCQIEPVLTKNGGAEYYYSTGTTTKPTAFTQGICSFRIPVTTPVQSNMRGRLVLDAGTYTMKLGLFLNAAGGTLTRISQNYREFALLRVLY